MGKFILFSLNLIFLFTYKFFFGGEVEVVQTFPEQVDSGEKFKVEVTINKGEREGFAKWQQELPEGFIATAIETAGATFSFKKNTVKLIWMAIPEQEEFTIKYEVQTDASINGEYGLQGKFSYIEDNERMDISTPEKKISIGFGGPALAQKEEVKPAEEEVPTEVQKSEEVPLVEEIPETKEVTNVVEASTTVPAVFTVNQRVTTNEEIQVQRKIMGKSNGVYEVSLIIDKQNFESFGKVEEYIPQGYEASELESDEGMFSFNNNVMKILWMALPPKSTIEVSYQLKSLGDELDSATVHGVFSYLKGEESVQLAMVGSRFPNTFGQSAPIAEKKDEPAKMEAETKEDLVEKPIAAEVPEVKEEKVEDQITSIPAPETSIKYRVQIAAGKKEVQPSYFVKRHGISESITTDYHNTWYKYMIGSYGVYKEARDKRNQVWAADNKISDAFVTAYNSGERITVQEALMITKQKWYK